MEKVILVAIEFSDYLVNRNKQQGDGTFTAQDFKNQFLLDLENNKWWSENNQIILDFKDVSTLSPSFANEVFATYTIDRKKEDIKLKIKFRNLSPVKKEIIDREIDSGYQRSVS